MRTSNLKAPLLAGIVGLACLVGWGPAASATAAPGFRSAVGTYQGYVDSGGTVEQVILKIHADHTFSMTCFPTNARTQWRQHPAGQISMTIISAPTEFTFLAPKTPTGLGSASNPGTYSYVGGPHHGGGGTWYAVRMAHPVGTC